MHVFEWDIPRYCDVEKDLCNLHKVSEDDELIEMELEEIRLQFASAFSHLTRNTDYEFPEWHHHIRLFWVYLYHDDFYTPALIPRIQQILASAGRSWFAEFECYSPARESPELPSGFFGDFLVYKDTVVFQAGDHEALKTSLGV